MDALSIIVTVVVSILTLVLLYVLYTSKDYRYFQKAGIPSLTPTPALGSGWEIVKRGSFEFHSRYYKKFAAEKVYGFFSASTPVLVVRDLDILRDIMVKNFNSFVNRHTFCQQKPFDKMMTQIKDEEWRHVRATVSPTFSTGKLRQMSQHVDRNVKNLMTSLRESCGNNDDVELKDILGCFTLDVIASTGFGVSLDSTKDKTNIFSKQAKEILNLDNKALALLAFFPPAMKLFDILGITIFPKEPTRFFSSFIDVAKEKRIKDEDVTGSKPNDFVQLLINEEMKQQQAKIDNVGNGQEHHIYQGLDYEQIQGQALVFIIAGYETVSSVLSYAMFALANNPDICGRLHQEIDMVLEGKAPTHETIQSLAYLDMCLNEALRMWPPAPFLDRVCNQDCVIQGIKMTKGLTIVIPTIAIHYDPLYYPDPEKFDPERFSTENKERRHPYAHLPFGQGPRNCIGMRLALMEMKMAMASILQELTPVPCEKTVYPPRNSNKFQIKADDGLWVKLVSRDH